MARNADFTTALHFHVEIWDRQDMQVIDVITMTKSADVARCAFARSVEDDPRRIIRLRHWMRVMLEHTPDR